MGSGRHLLTDFLNHGIVPFVGRKSLLETLHAFWKSTFDAEGLRLLCVIGEAGCGKSRLLEELLPGIRREGGSVLHLRLLPESSTSLALPAATALRHDRIGRTLLDEHQTGDFFAVLSAIRSLVRIRPTLIVVEDVHLLPDLPAGDFRSLVLALRDEPVSLLCISRKRDGLEQRLAPGPADIVEVQGLAPAAIGYLWQELFGAEPEGDVVELLVAETVGSPLALRSVLRGAVIAGLIDPNVPDGCNRPVCSLDEFAAFARKTLSDMGEGMTAGLLPDERVGAARLAMFGEAFARETAEVVLGGTTEVLDRLVFRGVLQTTSAPPQPLSDSSREYPAYPESSAPLLTFGHSVLHRYFARAEESDLEVLQTVLASDLPLYSLLPVRLFLRSLPNSVRYSPECGKALLRSLLILYDQVLSAEWERAVEPVGDFRRALDGLESAAEDSGDEVRSDLEVTTLFMEAVLADLQGDPARVQDRLMSALSRTEQPATFTTARLRIAALIKDPHQDWTDAAARRRVMGELRALGEIYPGLSTGPDYARVVCALGIYAVEGADFAMFDEVEAYYKDTMNRVDDESRREYLDLWFLPLLSQVFRSPEEAAQRGKQIRRLRSIRSSGPYDTHVAEHLMAFFFETGDWNALLRTARESRDVLGMKQMYELVVRGHARELFVLVGLGLSRSELERRVAEVLCEEHLDRRYALELLGQLLPEALWMRGDEEWAAPLVDGLVVSPGISPFLRAESGEPSIPSVGDFAERLKEEPLRIGDVLMLSAGIAWFTERGGDAGLPEVDVLTALERSFAWLQSRSLVSFMQGMIDRHEKKLPSNVLKRWKAAVGELHPVLPGMSHSAVEDERLFLSFVDAVRVRYPSGEWRKVTGGRMKTVLGLMVANQMFGQNLSLEECALLATGDELAETESARNNLYVRLHSLRSLLGRDSILSETGHAPVLDTSRVRVDLLEVSELLKEAELLIARNQPGKGLHTVRQALQLLGGSIPFPGLYDDFFEAARSDFEVLVWDTVLTVAKELVRHGDRENPVDLLEQVLDLFPGDEDIAGYLCELLGVLGRKSHAERIRRRTLRLNTLDPES